MNMNSTPFSWVSVTIFLTCYVVLGIHRSTIAAAAALRSNETDRETLIAIKQKISHDPLRVLDSWNDTIHFCQWPGVACNPRHQLVTGLNLSSLHLVGSLPPHIGNLTFLRSFTIRNNYFNGVIPREIGSLSRLRFFSLSYNLFTGEVPGNFSSCRKLQVLSIANNKLEGSIPPTLASLSEIQYLFIYQNSLSGNLPEIFENMSSLVLISAWGNSLSGRLPSSLANLQNLQYVFLYENNLSGRLPDSIGHLRNLKSINLSVNMFTGTIPPAFFNISTLIDIFFVDNRLEGVLPQDLGLKLPNLEELNLGGNSFSGTIPTSISNVSNLIRLSISGNNFSGRVPSLENLNRLQWLRMAQNQLGSGGIDDDLRFVESINSTDLKILEIQWNNFGGKLPESIGNLSNLKRLVIDSNNISGRIPGSIENLHKLESLKIERNQFMGGIPRSIGSLWLLKELTAYENQLTGEIPSSLGNLTMLTDLDISENYLNGTIPSSLMGCKNLLRLSLAKNHLSGSIPLEIFSITYLAIFLDISMNQLSGPLPREIGNLKQLSHLYAYENRLSGEVPSSLGKCVSLTILDIDSNSFQGNISRFLSSLTSLEHLDISNNNFSGHIPEFLGEFQFLGYLNLSFNRFEGEVPKEGIFQNASGVNLLGNPEICGGIKELNLPPCHFYRSKRSSSLSRKLVVLICTTGVMVVVVAILFLVFYLSRKKSRVTSTEAPSLGSLLQVSYETLLKATDGFSANNLIGIGGFGAIYRGVIEHEGNPDVAVKVLDLNRRGASKSFMAECEALRNIRHRNLLKIITVCTSVDFEGNEFKALVYEFMKKGSLDQWLHPLIPTNNVARKALSFLQRVNIAIDVASALEYLHHHCGAMVIHCDLKPSNVLLDDDMNGHVGDFGLARIFTDTHNSSAANVSSSVQVRGTVGYAAPEYGMGSKISKEGDVYSYGILLLEMFTGRKPSDEMFNETLNLHDYCKTALLGRVMEIVDPSLHGEIEHEKFHEFITEVIQIGVSCSMESPRDRMRTSDLTARLSSIKEKLVSLPRRR
ncbi:hypothetical protein SAY87_021851 [Trapa incisa]|uniref:non-specific serine/threonine protein kinase n=1 Tax=Trapa incisa TaxID=236973 RepID=A0AAN7JXP4_9MYRT|nr:hypothetical protein SAY87_021851 [Trapa incisa]